MRHLGMLAMSGRGQVRPWFWWGNGLSPLPPRLTLSIYPGMLCKIFRFFYSLPVNFCVIFTSWEYLLGIPPMCIPRAKEHQFSPIHGMSRALQEVIVSLWKHPHDAIDSSFLYIKRCAKRDLVTVAAKFVCTLCYV